ncbi:MAG: ABC transporter permease [Clostridiales bacterium]|jgi:hypothetical protein|nr:ABC transporter permease [Clostridiales bacterium]
MKILSVFAADLRASARTLPLIIAALAFSTAIFLTGLPPGLVTLGEPFSVSIAASSGDERLRAEYLSAALRDFTEDFYIVDREEGERLLETGQVDVYVEFPANLVDAMVSRGEAEVLVKSNNAVLGGVSYNLAVEAANVINRLQNISLAYYDAAGAFFSGDELYRSSSEFDISLALEALTRSQRLNVIRSVPQYDIQAVSLALFLCVSVTAVFFAVSAARQFSRGYMRRLAARRIGFFHVWAAKTLFAVVISVILSLAVSVCGGLLGVSVSFGRLALSAAVMALLIYPVCMVFSGAAPKSASMSAPARALLGCCAVLLLMLFAGGGFYPVYVMDYSFRACNPAWLAHLLSEWALGGAVPGEAALPAFFMPAAACTAISAVGWRKALC